jgi:hypothetical protein
MGLSFHYRGHLRMRASLPDLVEEVVDIAKVLQWPHHIFETEFPKNTFGRKIHNKKLYGVCFTPPECEVVSLCFLSNGKLIDFRIWFYHQQNALPNDYSDQKYIAVKTQYAGAEVHQQLMHLFDYLNQKYFRFFKLIDEGQYWELRDAELLQKKFAFLEGAINSFTTLLHDTKRKENESLNTFIDRLLKKFQASTTGELPKKENPRKKKKR